MAKALLSSQPFIWDQPTDLEIGTHMHAEMRLHMAEENKMMVMSVWCRDCKMTWTTPISVATLHSSTDYTEKMSDHGRRLRKAVEAKPCFGARARSGYAETVTKILFEHGPMSWYEMREHFDEKDWDYVWAVSVEMAFIYPDGSFGLPENHPWVTE